jgi:Domain of unknown function (DUF4193)
VVVDPEAEDYFDEEDENLENVELDDDEDDEAEPALAVDEDEDQGEDSLDELLARRNSARRGLDVDAEDDDDVIGLRSEQDDPSLPAGTQVRPMKDRQEFVCARCHLVKAKSQLADPQRGLCRDCV